jgi:hypothetical protein
MIKNEELKSLFNENYLQVAPVMPVIPVFFAETIC